MRPRGNRLAQGGQDRRAAGRHPAAPPLPVNRPTPALNAQIIRRAPQDGQALEVFRERQNVPVIFEQHQGFAHTRAPDGPVFGGTDGGREPGIGRLIFKQPELDLNAQNPPHGVVNARGRNHPGRHQLFQIRDELGVVVRAARPVGDHDHVQPGVDGLGDVGSVIR